MSGAVSPGSSQRPASPWILTRGGDLLLFIGAPVLMLPLIVLAWRHSRIEDVVIVTASFGAVGHHLPGMLRAYADRDLFRRFRVRFTVAPVFLLGVSLYFVFRDLAGLSVLLLLWGTWHFCMQLYGFARIYDAKARSFSRTTIRLDFLMCLTWFVAGDLFSPVRLSDLLVVFYDCGGPLLPPSAVHGLKWLWGALTIAVTAAFAWNHVRCILRGAPASFVKVLILFTGIGFWLFTMTGMQNVVFGLALFEIFHDIQYLAIVWIFNRKRVQHGTAAGPITGALFRPRGLMIGLYVGLVAAYGVLGFLIDRSDARDGVLILYGVVIASSFLHFYYDGFIWKVREKTTQEGLGLAAGAEPGAAASVRIPGWCLHGLKWALFVVPACLLGAAQMRGTSSSLERSENVVQAVPGSAQSRNELGLLLIEDGDYEAAQSHLRRAIALQPDLAEAHHNLGLALAYLDRFDESAGEYREAIRLAPDHTATHENLAIVLRLAGKRSEAADVLEESLRVNPQNAGARRELLTLLLTMSWELATDPDDARRRPAEAIELAERAVRVSLFETPEIDDVLSAAYAAGGRFDEAVPTAEAAVRLAARNGDYEYAQELAGRLALYRQGEPFRRSMGDASTESGRQ